MFNYIKGKKSLDSLFTHEIVLISGRTVPFSKVPFIPLEFHLKYISDKFKGAICTKQTESVVRGHSCVMNQ